MNSSSSLPELKPETSSIQEFSQHLCNLLKQTAFVSDSKIRTFVLSQITKFTTLNELSFIYTLVILKNISESSPECFRIRKIIDIIHQYMSDVEGGKLLSEAIIYSDNLPHNLTVPLLNIINSKRATSSDIIKLHETYSQSNHPSVSYLRNHEFLEYLTLDTFNSNGNATLIKDRLALLAIASAAIESPENTDILLNQPLVQETLSALNNLMALIKRVNSMSQIQDYFMSFLEAIKFPITCMALLFWLSEQLNDANFYDWTVLAAGVIPPAFYLFDEMAIQHPFIRPKLIKFWTMLVEKPFDIKEIKPVAAQKCRERFLDHLLIISKLEYAIDIFEYFLSTRTLDTSLILYFVSRFIEMLEPPFTEDMISILAQVVGSLPPIAVQEFEARLEMSHFFERVLASGEIKTCTRDLLIQALNILV